MDRRRIRLLNEVSTRMVEAWSDLQSIDIITGGSNTDSIVPASLRTVYFSHSLRRTGIDMCSRASALPLHSGWTVGNSL